MKEERRFEISDILLVVFMAIFALPFLGAYLMLDKDVETKVIGGILCIVGLAIWFWFGIR